MAASEDTYPWEYDQPPPSTAKVLVILPTKGRGELVREAYSIWDQASRGLVDLALCVTPDDDERFTYGVTRCMRFMGEPGTTPEQWREMVAASDFAKRYPYLIVI